MLCVCQHSQAPDVCRHVGGDLRDPKVQLVADVLGSLDQAAVSAGLDLHLRAGHRRRGRLHCRGHQRQDDHHHHDCTRSTVKLLRIPCFETVQFVFFCVVGGAVGATCVQALQQSVHSTCGTNPVLCPLWVDQQRQREQK